MTCGKALAECENDSNALREGALSAKSLSHWYRSDRIRAPLERRICPRSAGQRHPERNACRRNTPRVRMTIRLPACFRTIRCAASAGTCAAILRTRLAARWPGRGALNWARGGTTEAATPERHTARRLKACGGARPRGSSLRCERPGDGWRSVDPGRWSLDRGGRGGGRMEAGHRFHFAAGGPRPRGRDGRSCSQGMPPRRQTFFFAASLFADSSHRIRPLRRPRPARTVA